MFKCITRTVSAQTSKESRKCVVRTSSESEEHSIVEAQPQLRHPRQHRFQLDAAHDVTAHHTAIGIHLINTHTQTHTQLIIAIKLKGKAKTSAMKLQIEYVLPQPPLLSVTTMNGEWTVLV